MKNDNLDVSQNDINDELDQLEEELDLTTGEINDPDGEGEAPEGSSEEECSEQALANAYLLDLASAEDISAMAESAEEMSDISDMMGVAMERTIVRFDRKARLKHLNKQAELALARQANDASYRKLMKVWAWERALEKKIHMRYAAKAKQIAAKKIRDYASNGKKIAKPNPSTVAFKDKVSTQVAKKAVANSKKMFSNTDKKTAEAK